MEPQQTITQPVLYLPFEERTPSTVYRDTLIEIMDKGEEKYSLWHKENKKRRRGVTMRFDMKQGFPMITEREVTSKMRLGAIGEIVGFMNGARTLDELISFGCLPQFWEQWVTPEQCAKFGLEPGDLGPGSYGPSWTAYPTHDGRTFNQIDNLVRQIKEFPNIRTHYINPLQPYRTCTGNPDFKRDVVVAPCHGFVQVDADGDAKKLSVTHVQFSGDFLVGIGLNLVEYAVFGMMLASRLGYEFEEYVHFIIDAHIYERQYPFVEKILAREPRRLPTVTLNTTHERLQDFRNTDFDFSDYDHHPYMKIPTPV